MTAPVDKAAPEWPSRCDGVEQPAFEAWAKARGFAMQEHPWHYIFLDEKTDASRHAWVAGLEHAAARAEAALAKAFAAGALAMREAAVACCGSAKASAFEHYGIAESVGADMARNRIMALPLPIDAQAAIERVREEEREALIRSIHEVDYEEDAPDMFDSGFAEGLEAAIAAIRARGGKP